jgi:predicted TIM-barrel fold metal-dependent hydrolase
MSIFDCHIHVQEGLENYNIDMINGNVIFNSISDYTNFNTQYTALYHSLIFDTSVELQFYNDLIINKKIQAIKIHSRLQKISVDKYSGLISALQKLDSNIPIIYDAFYFGSDLKYQPSLSGLIKLIKAFPKRKFIIAHSGGYEVLKYFFHLREFKNVGFDLSFSLQYLHDTSLSQDLMKLLKYTDNHKIFYGSDYPYADPKLQFENLYFYFDKLNFNSKSIDGIMNSNWLNFINY